MAYFPETYGKEGGKSEIKVRKINRKILKQNFSTPGNIAIRNSIARKEYRN